MAKTAQLGLPLVMPAQAQKHVPVNEALAILDAVAQLRLVSTEERRPPEAPEPGQTFAVPEGAFGEWAAQGGKLATFSNGGWTYLRPRIGWQAWVEAEQQSRRFDGTVWLSNAISVAPGGSAVCCLVHEFDHAVQAGPANATAFHLPANAVILGVTGRVIESMDAPGLTTWRLGVAGSDNRYGSGLGTGLNAYVHGMTGVPMTYYEPTPLLLSAHDAEFAGGVVRLAVGYIELAVPRAV